MDSSDEAPPARLPLLAYVYNPRSFGTLSLSESADGVCDLLWVVDTSKDEVAQMARLLRRLGSLVDIAGLDLDAATAAIAAHEPQGILTLADDELRVAAELAERLGLPFHSPDTALRLTDKFAQRRALRDAGLVAPRSWVIEADAGDETWATLEHDASFPAVLKPRRGEGSRDTVPVRSFAELRELVDQTRVSKGTARAFVLEEYIPDAPDGVAGEGFAGYVSVESFVCAGRVTHLAVTGRMPPAEPFRETGFFIPSALSGDQVRGVLDVARAAAMAVGVTIGCLHTEIKLTPSGPVVIEVNGRVGGGVPELMLAVTSVRVLSIAMRLALGETVVSEEMPPCDGLSYLFYVQAPSTMRTVSAVEGIPQLQAVAGVRDVVLNRGPGQSVDWREGNHGHVFSVLGVVADHDELKALARRVADETRIEGE